jgi:hypothetical protein
MIPERVPFLDTRAESPFGEHSPAEIVPEGHQEKPEVEHGGIWPGKAEGHRRELAQILGHDKDETCNETNE